MRIRWLIAVATLAAPLGMLSRAQAPAPWFRDVTRDSGITFTRHHAPEKRYILESMSGGVALFDYDGDGRLDLYLVDSLTVATASDRTRARSALYRNLGGLRFENVTNAANVAHPGWGMGVCTADFDGDRRHDLYVTGFGGNRLYRNHGDGTFADVTARAGVGASGWSTGCGFADYDRDGDLDLFVSRYIEVDLAKLPQPGSRRECFYRGIAVQCGPRGLAGESDLLFRNDGDGRFTEVSAAAGVSDPERRRGLGIAWLDYDRDGWLDLYVASDAEPSLLYRNDGRGAFREVGLSAGVAVSEDGAEQGGMGVAVGDYDNSGRWSLFKTNFADEANNLYRHDGSVFTDAAGRARLAATSTPYVGWGASFLDADNDGFLDLAVANGHVYPQAASLASGSTPGYLQPTHLYRNRRDGTFEEVSSQAGAAFAAPRVGRGLAVGDLDNDGGLDVVINDLDGAPLVLHNERPDRGHWISVLLEGAARNTNAIGAVVTVRAGGLTQTRVVQSGTSYLSQDDMRRHFGLGSATTVASIDVQWPDGATSTMKDVTVNRIVTMRHPGGK